MTEPTHDSRDLTGAMYFVVGRGTEGGAASYRLSVAGVTDSHWGDVNYVKQNSGYSIGTIQVDLGQRGTWPVGSIDGSGGKDAPSYVDAVITQSAAYARTHSLSFPEDHAALRSDLLTHGNGKHDRPTISFISNDTRNTINDWASSVEGKKWIHANVDYPQVKNATEVATRMIDGAGERIPEDHRLETVAILAKTANQFPSQLKRFQAALDKGGGYDEVLKTAQQIKQDYDFYDGPKAADLARAYKSASNEHERGKALQRAEQKVAARNFDPSSQATDNDIREALHAIGGTSAVHSTPVPTVLRAGSHGAGVSALQAQLNELSTPSAGNRMLRAVDVAQAVNTPLEQSGNAFVQAAQQQAQQPAVQQQTQDAPSLQPAMHR